MALILLGQGGQVKSPRTENTFIKPIPIPTLKRRAELGRILGNAGMPSGVELGVQRGLFADEILQQWVSCKHYVLVDLWKHQENYEDAANFQNDIQTQYKEETTLGLKKYEDRVKIEMCQNYTSACAEVYKMRNHQFDFIYVEPRHDYKGVLEDLQYQYPLLQPGGIFAGHDFVTNDEVTKGDQDWSINYDATKDETGRVVKGAVDDFANKHGLKLTISYRERGWNTWAARKPIHSEL